MTVDNYINALERIRNGLENVNLAVCEVIGALKAERLKAQREAKSEEAKRNALLLEKEISAFNFTKKEIDKMPNYVSAVFKNGRIKAKIRKRNGYYEIRCQIFNHKISSTSKNLETAKKRFVDKLNAVLLPRQEKDVYSYSVLFSTFADKWLEIKKRTTKTATFNEYARQIERDLKPAFNGLALHQITREMVQSYLFTKVDAGKMRTAQKLKLVLKCIFDLAESDYNLPSPMKKVVLPPHEKKRGEPLSLAEERTLVEFCQREANVASSALLVTLYFGLRRGELKTIEVNGSALTVTTGKTRLGQEVKRTIPFTPAFKNVLAHVDFETARNTNVNTIYTTFKRLFPNHHPHELRYTFISRCKECGVNPEVVMLWAGHEADGDVKSSRVNRRYTVYSPEYLEKEALKVNYTLYKP